MSSFALVSPIGGLDDIIVIRHATLCDALGIELNARKDMVPPRSGPFVCMLIVDTPVHDVE